MTLIIYPNCKVTGVQTCALPILLEIILGNIEKEKLKTKKLAKGDG